MVYANNSEITSYSKRILGDATGEMGPFDQNSLNNWYNDFSYFIDRSNPWFNRGGYYGDSSVAGQFFFSRSTGDAHINYTSRLVLTP